MSKAMENLFLRSIKDARCLVCGKRGVDIAHIRPWSFKLNGFGARSHKGAGWFFAIPLCREHHNAIHKTAEGTWLDKNIDGGRLGAYRWIYNQLNAARPAKCKKIEVVPESTDAEGYAAAARRLIDECYMRKDGYKPKGGKFSRDKGARGERAWKQFLESHGVNGVQRLGHAQTSQAVKVPDVVHGDYAAQVKYAGQLRLYESVEQARKESLGKVPYVAWKQVKKGQSSNRPWVVLLHAEDFVKLIKELEEHGGTKAT